MRSAGLGAVAATISLLLLVGPGTAEQSVPLQR